MIQSLHDCSHSATPSEPVHEARVHLKKLLALLRLLRPFIGEEAYVRERGCFRRAARRLSGYRDAAVCVFTLERLAAEAPSEARAAVEIAREVFTYDLEQRRVPARRTLDAVGGSLTAATAAAKEWTFTDCSVETLCESATQIYRRAYRAARRAGKSASTEDLHRWRRRTKELWSILRLLREMHGKRLTRMSRVARDFGEILGLDHDLAMLTEAVAPEDGPAILSPEELEHLQGLIAVRRQELQRRAWKLAEIVYAKKPAKFQDSLLHRWKKWRKK